ncbi:MAG: hypothetical protein FGM24_05025 [Candidatus Kapabacteria bacterium]|nr:hypothetical protein [Candidatus Kapabacteria bacterium]
MKNIVDLIAPRPSRAYAVRMGVVILLASIVMVVDPLVTDAQAVFDVNDRTGVIVCDDGRVRQWGLEARNVDLGAGIVPVQVVKSQGTYGIDAAGNVYAWEVECQYHFPDVDSIWCMVPRELGLPAPMRQVDASDDCILYVDVAGGLWGAGLNTQNRFMGSDTPEVVVPPRRIQMPGPVREVRVGSGNIVAVLEDGTVWTWGANQTGQAGTGDTATYTPVRQVETLRGIRSVRSDSHIYNISPVFAIDSGGRLFGWGWNRTGQLGDGTTVDRWEPVQIAIEHVIDVRNGNDHTVALTADGSVWTWGSNTYGELGLGHDTSMLTPQRVPTLRNIRTIGVADLASVAIDADGVWWGWGFNYSRQLPGLSYEVYRTPVRCTPPCLASSAPDTRQQPAMPLAVWPQPAHDVLNVVTTHGHVAEPAMLTITDIRGLPVMTVPCMSIDRLQVSTAGMASGLYTITLDVNGTTLARTLVSIVQ